MASDNSKSAAAGANRKGGRGAGRKGSRSQAAGADKKTQGATTNVALRASDEATTSAEMPAKKRSPSKEKRKPRSRSARASVNPEIEHRRDEALSTAPPEIEQTSVLELPDHYSTESMDKAFKAHMARFTLGITPAGLMSSYFEWLAHLTVSPGKQAELVEKAERKLARLLIYIGNLARNPQCGHCIEPLEHDDRFDGDAWQTWPFNVVYQSFLLTQQWWHIATNNIDGLPPAKERSLSFVTRQVLDHFSPSNFVATNPEVLQATVQRGGMNLYEGMQNFMEDWERAISGKLPVGAEDFVVGRDLATTPGKVVFRNHLIELIQYEPRTDEVYSEPILIVPAWIMKYYILDLSPHNSLVGYLVDQGYTVFMVSWRNPGPNDRDLGMEDYRNRGVMDALDAATTIVPDEKVHAVGYCIGGTLLAIAAAAMARDGDDRLESLTFFATQTDFSDAGELMLFISESQVSYLENMMWDQGYLDTKQMAGAFQLLRSNDLIWSRHVQEYLLGKRQEMFDLMAWNADATRMPYKMHSEYLRRLFLNNALAQGQYVVNERPVTITDIKVPIFCVSTTKDHVAPWHSVYKIHLLADTDVTFVLNNRGHNAGIVSEPGHKGREYQIRTQYESENYLSPAAWRDEAPKYEGSWWPEFADWLAERSSGHSAPPGMGAPDKGYTPSADAPGTYVYQR